MSIRFTKMHGIGNDYIYVECLRAPGPDAEHVSALARAMSDRHRGIGADGLILITPAEDDLGADVRMEMYNADGSRGEMCGNGIRCVAKYVLDRRLAGRVEGPRGWVRVQTDRGVLELSAVLNGGAVTTVRVDMGSPILRPADIPVNVEGDRCVGRDLAAGGERLAITCVSMGNPHAVAFVESCGDFDLAGVGPRVERDGLFPNRVNFHVASVRSRSEAIMRSWERGSGLTMACGTGACAVLVAGVLEGRLDREAVIHLPGGSLTIEWPEPDTAGPSAGGGPLGTVFMTGTATEVFSGKWPT